MAEEKTQNNVVKTNMRFKMSFCATTCKGMPQSGANSSGI